MPLRDGRTSEQFLSTAELDELERPPSRFDTPPHNGPYLGPVPVRTLPVGLSGVSTSELVNYGHKGGMRSAIARACAKRGRERARKSG